MADSDSDEDTFVTIGTPLEPLDEGNGIRKPVTVEDQKVRDEKGRQRFHGAFTGGFSAGYFNTVGSKEGWTPSTFVSSRGKKAEKYAQHPEDYMDTNDLGEFGIAPRQVSTSVNFSSDHRENERKRKLALASSGVIPGLEGIIQDIVPSQNPIGVRLLQKMGWKSGQGIGPRSRRRHRKPASTKGIEGSGVRTFGCALGPEPDSENSDDDLPEGFTFAPKDSTPISFEAKDDVHGIGYRGIDPSSALHSTSRTNRFSLFEPPVTTSTSKGRRKGITGQAFGIGALEDDDDGNIYALDNMSKYDTVIGGDDEGDRLHGWTAPGSRMAVTSASYVGQLLEGFTLSSKPLAPKKVFPPPRLPKDFKPIHVFKKAQTNSSDNTKTHKKMDASTRQAILGEQVEIGSVFDLISKEDKQKIESMTTTPKTGDVESIPKTTPPVASRGNLGMLTSGGFKPFAKDEQKQNRYEAYLEAAKQGKKYELDEGLQSAMTDWEKEHEKEEFVRAAQLYRPMTSMMSSRFTRAKYEDSETVQSPTVEGEDKNDQVKAAELKMFGRLTRQELEWHPDRLLCKRFNIPDPYPGSTFVGLPSLRKDKFSMFNFLSFHDDKQDTSRDEKTEASPPKAIEYSLAKPGESSAKKVNIFSKIDELHKPSVKHDDEETTGTKMDTESIEHKIPQPETTKSNDGIDRPPMDLFKAIFQDSSDSSSSDDEEQNAAPTHEVSVSVMETSRGIGHEADVSTHLQSAKTSKNEQQSESAGEEDTYGPCLPPPDQQPTVMEDQSSTEVFKSFHTYNAFVEKTKDKPREKTKEKSKKHKEKHKHKKDKKKKSSKSKHKHKSKKRKKKHTSSKAVSSDSSDYEGSSEDSDKEQSTSAVSDKDILNKMKRLSEGKRLTAADFM